MEMTKGEKGKLKRLTEKIRRKQLLINREKTARLVKATDRLLSWWRRTCLV